MKKLQANNKAIWGGLAVLVTQLIVNWLNGYGYEVSPELSVAITTVITAFVVWLVPNIAKVDDILLALAKERGLAWGFTPQQIERILAAIDDIATDDFAVSARPTDE